LKTEDLKGYGDFMKMKINEKTPEQVKYWTDKQTYIALGNALYLKRLTKNRPRYLKGMY